MNKALLGILAAGSFATAQAQTPPTAGIQADTQARTLSSFLVPLATDIPGITAGVRHDSRYGLGGTLSYTEGDEQQAVGVTATVLSDSKSVKVAGAKKIIDSVMLTGYVGERQDNAAASFGNPGYAGDISAVEYGAGLQVKVNEYMTAGVSITRGSTTGGLLRSDIKETIVNRVVDTPDSTKNMRDTFQSRTDTIAEGGQYTVAKANASYQPTLKDIISADIGARKSSITGDSVVGGVSYAHEFDSGDSIAISGAHVAPRVNRYEISYTNAFKNGAFATIGVDHRTGTHRSTGVVVKGSIPLDIGSSNSNPSGKKQNKISGSNALESVNAALKKEIEPPVGNTTIVVTTSVPVLASSILVSEVAKPKPPENTAPIANPDTASVVVGQTVTISPLTNDADANGDVLSISSIEQPSGGGTAVKQGNNIVFTSNGTTGTYAVKYWVYDGKANSLTPGVITITVTAAEVPNTPLVLGSINCTATIIQHGGSTTCQITPIDPQGIVSLRAEIDGVPVTVSVSGGTYSIPVSGLSAGTADGVLTSQNHIIKVYATGKKPDGSAETEQSATATVTVQCNGTWYFEPSIPGSGACSL